MKNYLPFVFIPFSAFIISCSKNNAETADNIDQYVAVKYDTTAIDSFSNGASQIDIAQKIKVSSASYQDSLKKVLAEQEMARKIKEEEDKLKEAAKKSLETEAAKKETPKTTSQPQPQVPEVPKPYQQTPEQ